MDELNICLVCSCSCWLVSADCILNNSELTAINLIRTNDINNTNDDVGDLIGEVCFEELCAAVKNAIEEANTHNEANPEDLKNLFDFLADKWTAILCNRHFKKWYANRVAYHWFEGSSITQLKKVGLITTSNDDEEFKNNFTHAEEKQRKRLSDSAAMYAGQAKNKFQKHFWSKQVDNYSCHPDCLCEESDEAPGTSIGFDVL